MKRLSWRGAKKEKESENGQEARKARKNYVNQIMNESGRWKVQVPQHI